MSIETGGRIHYSVALRDRTLLEDNPVSMTLDNGVVLGQHSHLEEKKVRNHIKETIRPVVPTKSSLIKTEYSEATLTFSRGFQPGFPRL